MEQPIISDNRRIAKAAFILILGNIAGFTFSFFKEILVAAKFGVGPEMDAFYAASSFPNIISGVLLSIFAAVFIPVFIEYELKEKSAAQQIINIFVSYITVIMALVIVVLLIFAGSFVRLFFYGLPPEVSALTVKLLRVFLLMLIFSCFSGIMIGILNAEKHFAVPAFSGLLVTLFTVAGIFLWQRSLGIFALAWGVVLGTLAQALLLAAKARKSGYVFKPLIITDHPALAQIKHMLMPFAAGIVIAEFNPMVDKVMSSGLAAGSIAALGYAGKLAQVPMQIFSNSIAAAAFPFFATQVAEDKIEKMKYSLARSIRMAGFILIPITAALMVLARPLISLLFERGKFTPQATSLTAVVFRMYCLQLFFYAAFLIMSRVVLSLKKIMFLFKLAILNLVLNVVLNLVFMRLFDPPVAGIALSTSVVYFTACAISYFYLKRALGDMSEDYLARGFLKVGACSLAMGVVVFFVQSFLGGHNYYSGLLDKMIPLFFSILAGLASFMTLAYIFKIEEQKELLALLKARINFGTKG